MEITSVNNDLVKECSKLLQKKYRNSTSKFILEGYKAIKEAYDAGIELETVFVDKSKTGDFGFIENYIITNEAVLKKLSSTESAPCAVAIGVQKKYNSEILRNLKKVVLLENIKDAGNFGTIIRSAVAFGVDAVVLYGDCIDIYNPKCVRSSVGNLWKLPIVHLTSFEELQGAFSDFTRVATLPKAVNLLGNYQVNLPALIMFGSEADGLSKELIEFSNDSLKIEMAKTVESLNLASSFSIIAYNLFVCK